MLVSTCWISFHAMEVSQKVDDLPDVIKLLQFERDESRAAD